MNDAAESRTLRLHVLANVVSFGLVGVSGVLMILGIARIYGPAAVGVFDQVYSIYIVLSQIVTAGIHQSVLKYSAQYDSEPETLDVVFTAAMVTVGTGAAAMTGGLYLIRGVITGWLGSPGVDAAAAYIFPGLFFFAMNKVVLAYLNGRRHMFAFAAFQSMRSLLLLGSLGALMLMSRDGGLTPVIFSTAEGGLFLSLSIYAARTMRWRWDARSLGWVKEHASFGLRAMGAPMIAELNTRLNVLILGAYAADAQVGVFSLAVMIFDGYNQLTVVARNVYNPILTQTFARAPEELSALAASTKRQAYKVMVPFALVIVVCFPVLLRLLHLDARFEGSVIPLAILMCGAAVGAGYVPIGQLLNQTGHPGAQSYLSLAVCGANAVLNVLLVPALGMAGSAFATALSSVVQVAFLRRLVRSRLGFAP